MHKRDSLDTEATINGVTTAFGDLTISKGNNKYVFFGEAHMYDVCVGLPSCAEGGEVGAPRPSSDSDGRILNGLRTLANKSVPILHKMWFNLKLRIEYVGYTGKYYICDSMNVAAFVYKNLFLFL